MMEPPAEIKKTVWATDGGGSGMKFFEKDILTWNPGFKRRCCDA